MPSVPGYDAKAPAPTRHEVHRPRRPGHAAFVWTLAKSTVEGWRKDEASRYAASLSYYTILSIAPLVLVAISIAGLAFGRSATEQQVVAQFGGLVGQDGAETLRSMIDSASRPSRSIPGTIAGFVVLLFGASGVLAELQASLNHMWEVAPRPGANVRRIVLKRLLSFGMVLGIGFLLLVSLVIGAALAALGDLAQHRLPGGDALWQAVHAVVSLAVVAAVFALMFRFLPDAKVKWRFAWIGAAITAILFTLGRVGIGLYIGKTGVVSSHGAAGSVVLLLVWVYYSAQILFFGAELTQSLANLSGAPIVPTRDAVKEKDAASAARRR